MVIIIPACIWIIIHSYIFLQPASYFSEVIISFLPYIILADSMIVILCVFSLFFSKNKIRLINLIIIICFYIWTGWIYYHQYSTLYQDIATLSNNETQAKQSGLSFFYGNIYYQNNNFSGIISNIKANNPDIVLLVEYAKIHDENLSPLLKKDYPYVSRYVWGKWYDGDVIYSKYPLTKIKHVVYPWSFSHVSIEYMNTSYDFALIHTSAPVSQHFFNMRIEQLDNLQQLMTEYYKNTYKKTPIVLLGDFNLSPRSWYYDWFNQKMKTIGLEDITMNTTHTTYYTTIPYTRCHEQASWICSHIDHIRSNDNNISLQKITIPWSDHYGFVGKL
jgi:endonuclease/exonuclease/phosphatase (EEP) superfamily protein YafD